MLLVVQPGQPAWKKIREQFGNNVFLEDGQLDRDEMARLVFSDASKREQLNRIMHPEIRKMMIWYIFLFFLKGKQTSNPNIFLKETDIIEAVI